MREPKEATELDLSDLSPVTGTATEDDMGILHGTVAKVLTVAVKEMPSPAYLGAAIAFLKNNNITASPSQNKDLAALRDTLAAKRKRGELGKRTLEEAAAAFEQHTGPLQ